MALGFHEEAESTYVLPLVPDLPPAQDTAGGHQALLAGLEDLQRCLHEELGRTMVIPRTQRQLVGKVIALLIAQADLLDEEEERLLPVLRHHLSEAEQLAMAQRLLVDPASEDEPWMLDWVAHHLTESERHALAALVARFAPVPPAWPRVLLDECAPRGAARSSTADGETAMTTAKISGASPIDVMYLLHKALRAEAWRTVRLVERLALGDSLHPFLEAFARWEQTLTFHAEQEDRYMTPLLPASALARDNEMSHQRLAHRMAAIRSSVRESELEAVTARTRRRLFGHVVALQIAQDDHLEEEEELVLPMIRERLSAAQQGEIMHRLLRDPQAADPTWVVTWLRHELTETECHLLGTVTARWAHTSSATVVPTV